MQSPEMSHAIAVIKKFLLSPPEHDHEEADCPMAAVEALPLSKRQMTKATRAALLELMQAGYVIRQGSEGGLLAIHPDDLPPDVREGPEEARS